MNTPRPTNTGAIQIVTCDGQTVMVPLYQLALAYSGITRLPPGSIGLIQKACAKHYGVTMADIRSKSHDGLIVRARHVAMYLVKTLTDYSLPAIARRFGRKNHTTALHAVRKIARLAKTDAGMAADIDMLRMAIAAGEASA
jgi:hypothetical protein